jgi:hypothetical protein
MFLGLSAPVKEDQKKSTLHVASHGVANQNGLIFCPRDSYFKKLK